LKIIFL